jgi:hypothetical protein
MSDGHIWTDRPGIDPAMQALVVERQLRRAGNKLRSLDRFFPETRRLSIAAQQCRFVADRLAAGEGVDTFDATIWLEAARQLIRTTIRELTEE